jgi:uncharacterized protein YgbK (DUF1537 family)
MPIKKRDLLDAIPAPWPEDLLPEIRAEVLRQGSKIVVLDDDPTGNQTVHDVAVFTRWSVPALIQLLEEPDPVAYVLTNSRSLSPADAESLTRDIARNLMRAREKTGREFVVVSRSDSTLRGHYPAEVQTLIDALGSKVDGTLIIPFFQEGGRLTANDIHYVTEGDRLIPAAETEYADDATFGYAHSNLRAWVAEKHRGELSPSDVAHVPLRLIREGGPHAVADVLRTLSGRQVCVVNAVSYRDLEVFVAGLLSAEAEGKRFVYRTAASFVRVRGGIAPRPLLKHADLDVNPAGGLVVVGSHVRKTTQQLEALRTLSHLAWVELDVRALLRPSQRKGVISEAADGVSRAIETGRDAVLYTSREPIVEHPTLTPLQIGERISDALVRVVSGLGATPGWVVAKGGITASVIATRALGIERADVLGQAIPGVPVWQTGKESRWPDLPYVVFPGNVGDVDAVRRMVGILRGEEGPGASS